MDAILAIAAALIGYLIGAVSFARLVTHFVAPETNLQEVDIPSAVTGEPIRLQSVGATTASVKLGSRWGCLIGLLDILKVAMPALVFRFLYPDQPYFLIVAAFGMAGHNWPIYYRFKGGSGMSSIVGGFLVVDPLGAILCLFAGLAFGLFIVRDILVAYLSGAWFMIPWLWFNTRDPAYLAYAIAVNAMFMLSLIPEIRMQIEYRRAGNTDIAAGLETFPMGRGMLKLMNRFSIKPRK